MFVEHRELKRIVDEVLVVLDVQVLVVHFVGGDAAQLVEDVSLGTGDVEVAADRLPTADFARFNMKILTAVEHD